MSLWLKRNQKDVMKFSKGYIDYLNNSKTERECLKESVKLAIDNGYKDMDEIIKAQGKLKKGDKVYRINMDKNVILFNIGSESLTKGLNVLGAHIDSPRLDIKQRPVYEKDGLVLLKTHYYGGVKKYQWVARPLAMHGVVCKKDGTIINVNIGSDVNDPVIGISDLLPHLAAEQMDKKASKVIEGEDLNPLIGSIPQDSSSENSTKEAILTLLKDKYNIEEDDFISSELELVPADMARDYGLDRSMIIGYGHDDRVCAYTSLCAFIDTKDVKRTSCCVLVDKEEVGSNGASGMHSRFFENTIAELLDLTGEYTELNLRRCLSESYVLSSDVSAASDPNYLSVNDPYNSCHLSKGICLNKYTGARGKGGCNDANPEYIAKLRNIFDSNDVVFQTAELGKVDQGGGGTIAYILANLNMHVIDAGIAVQNMHAPSEVLSKVDVYEAYRAYKVFLEKI